MERPVRHDAIFWLYLILFLGSVEMFGWLIWSFVPVIIIAMVLTSIFRPLYRWLNRRMRRSIASIITCAIISLY